VYAALDSGDADVEAIARLMKSGIDQREAVLSDGSADLWRELGPWLLLPALPLASLAFRRGALWVLVIGCAAMPPEATAFDWNSLWLNQQQRAEKLFENGDYEAAATLFEDPAWRAAAEYRADDFDSAQQTLDGIDDETALYNRGNALAGLGRYEDALQAWGGVLQMNPSHEDARYNRQALEDWLRRQRQQQEQQQDGEGDRQQDRQQSAENEPRAGDNSQPNEQAGDDSDAGDAGERQQADSRQPQPSENESRSQAQPSQATPQAQAPSSPESEQEALARIDQQMSEQAAEQWLRKIPDDPGGLLRRKFIYQYRKRGGVDEEGQAW
jgi:Ca-activated chloride channel homolog